MFTQHVTPEEDWETNVEKIMGNPFRRRALFALQDKHVRLPQNLYYGPRIKKPKLTLFCNSCSNCLCNLGSLLAYFDMFFSYFHMLWTGWHHVGRTLLSMLSLMIRCHSSRQGWQLHTEHWGLAEFPIFVRC